MMTKNTFLTVIGIMFLIGILVHLSRLIWDWPILIGNWIVPKWFSVLAIVIAAYFSWNAFKLRNS